MIVLQISLQQLYPIRIASFCKANQRAFIYHFHRSAFGCSYHEYNNQTRNRLLEIFNFVKIRRSAFPDSAGFMFSSNSDRAWVPLKDQFLGRDDAKYALLCRRQSVFCCCSHLLINHLSLLLVNNATTLYENFPGKESWILFPKETISA